MAHNAKTVGCNILDAATNANSARACGATNVRVTATRNTSPTNNYVLTYSCVTSASPSPAPDASAAPDTATPDPVEPPLVATVLLSDGANSTGTLEPLDAAGLAAEAGVPIYTIALGTQDGVVTVPDQLGVPRQLNVPPDTRTLAEIAEVTGARFFEAPTADDLAAIYESLGSKVGSTFEEQEVTQWFAAGALVLVLVGGGLAALWFNRFP